MERKMKNIFFLFIALLFVSCELEAIRSFENEVPEETELLEESELFNLDDESNSFIFQTNESKYITENGYTIWTAETINESSNFVPVSATLFKESGKSNAGFGIVFCCQKIDEKPYMLTVLINTEGYYTVGKVIDGYFIHIINWTSTKLLNKGFGTKNTVSVSYNTDDKKFSLSFNGTKETEFSPTETLVFKNSKSGFVVVIADNENFPAIPVKVSFKNN